MAEVQQGVYRMVHYFPTKLLAKENLFGSHVKELMVFGIADAAVHSLVRGLVELLHSLKGDFELRHDVAEVELV